MIKSLYSSIIYVIFLFVSPVANAFVFEVVQPSLENQLLCKETPPDNEQNKFSLDQTVEISKTTKKMGQQF